MKPLLICLLIMISLGHYAFAAESEISIIANLAVPVSQLNLEEVKDIYLLNKQQWSDGSSIVIINRPSNSEIRRRFEQEILGTTPKKYALHIEKKHYLGFKLPVIQESTQAVITFVQNVHGAIAYIEGLPKDNQVKVLMVVK
jgi:ABC-type phosphate transport system substrate-binding protein